MSQLVGWERAARPSQGRRILSLDDVAGKPLSAEERLRWQVEARDCTTIGRNSRLGRNAAGARPSTLSPTDPLSIVTSRTPIFFFSGDLLVTESGGLVSAWGDNSGNAWSASQAIGAAQPVYNATGLNGRGTITTDGVDDRLTIDTLNIPAPGTTPTWWFLVFNAVTDVTNGSLFCHSNSTGMRVFRSSTPTQMRATNATSGPLVNRSLNTWYRGAFLFANTTADYVRIGSNFGDGTATGNTDVVAGTTSFGAASGGTLAGNYSYACAGAWAGGDPTSGELAEIDEWVTAYYGPSVEV